MPQDNATYKFTRLFGSTRAPVGAQMDPRLQKLIAFRRSGIRKPATSSTDHDEVAVIAKVTDLKAWNAQSEVRPGAMIGPKANDGTYIVTARIPVSRIEVVRARPFVKSMNAARRLSPTLAATTQEILALPELLPSGAKRKTGKGAIVGIVDIGCDFAHRNFMTSTGKTRLHTIWDQWGSGGGVAGGVTYGSVYNSAQINSAITKTDPYTALGYGPEPVGAAHGTHVMDIAAGNGRGSGVRGVAPDAGLIFVEVANSDIPWEGPETVGKNFGDSVQLLEAMKFVFDEAGSAPCAINVSLGTNGGPHDGSSLVEQGIDRLITQEKNRAVVIAASNSFADGIHAAGTVPKTGTLDLPWIVAAGDWTDNELELWYAGSSRLSVEILQPNGTSVGMVPPGESGTVTKSGKVILFAANRLNDPNNGDNMIGVYLHPNASSGKWKLRLKSLSNEEVGFHAWVERDDAGQSTFQEPHDNSRTLGSISCGHHSIVVGSYDAHKPDRPLSWFSSSGPTRDGREKPEVSAPGHAVMAAKSRSKTGVTSMSGTSMAAPAATGAIALMLAEAKARNKSLSVAEIRQALISTAQRTPPAGTVWESRYGAGRVSAKGLIATVMGVSPVAKESKKKKAARKEASKLTKSPPKKAGRKLQRPAGKAAKAGKAARRR